MLASNPGASRAEIARRAGVVRDTIYSLLAIQSSVRTESARLTRSHSATDEAAFGARATCRRSPCPNVASERSPAA
jgi:transposase-like protein